MTHVCHQSNIIRLAEVDSTLAALARHVHSAPHTPAFTTYIADQQSAGRGRSGRQWSTLPGQALLIATLVPMRRDFLAWTTALAGLATLEALRPYAHKISLKWPNDVLFEGEKIAGILCEHLGISKDGEHLVAVGIGVNLTSPPPQAGENAAALPNLGGADEVERARERILNLILTNLASLTRPEPDTPAAAHIARWRLTYEAALDHLGKPSTVRLPNGEHTRGTAIGISEDAGLRLLTDDGEELLISVGDVELPSQRSPYHPSSHTPEGE